MAPKKIEGVQNGMTPCDVCDGTGTEEDAGGWPVDCHLCEGAGFFGEDGFPIDDETEPT